VTSLLVPKVVLYIVYPYYKASILGVKGLVKDKSTYLYY
jgi:hypothetical protein